MDWSALIAPVCVAVTLFFLVRGRIASDLVMAGGISLLVLTGSLSPKDAFSGLASPSILTIALLLVVSQGVIETVSSEESAGKRKKDRSSGGANHGHS